MSALVRVALSLRQWLDIHNIDADKVNVVLRAKDEETKRALDLALHRDLCRLTAYVMRTEDILPGPCIAGVTWQLTSLDERAPPPIGWKE